MSNDKRSFEEIAGQFLSEGKTGIPMPQENIPVTIQHWLMAVLDEAMASQERLQKDFGYTLFTMASEATAKAIGNIKVGMPFKFSIQLEYLLKKIKLTMKFVGEYNMEEKFTFANTESPSAMVEQIKKSFQTAIFNIERKFSIDANNARIKNNQR